MTDEILKWTAEVNKYSEKLQKFEIEAPLGKRKISQFEADRILSFLDGRAEGIIKKSGVKF